MKDLTLLAELFDPLIPCCVAQHKQRQQKKAMINLRQQGYRVALLFADYLLVQPGAPQQRVTTINNTIGIKALTTLGNQIMMLDSAQLKEKTFIEQLNTGTDDERYIELIRMMEQDTYRLQRAIATAA